MDKIQIIEKLFQYLLIYSYLLIPVLFIVGLFSGRKKTGWIKPGLALYGILFFFFLHYFYSIPLTYRYLQLQAYTFLEFSFFAFFFWHSLISKLAKKIIVIFTILFLVFQVAYYFYSLSAKYRVDSIPIGIETLFIFYFSLLYFVQFFKHTFSSNLYEYASFWLVVGIIVYLGFSFFFNILANFLTKEEFNAYWKYTYFPEMLKNVLFALIAGGIIYKKKKKIFKPNEIPKFDMI